MNLRIHPAIGISRVGNSEQYVISPETMAGRPMPGGGDLTGGLPIRADTESVVIRSSDLRDDTGALKRHAARFRVFLYGDAEDHAGGLESWPRGDGSEVRIGSKLPNGRTIADIIWTVHVANKKANAFMLAETGYMGRDSYAGRLPGIRNVSIEKRTKEQPPDEEKIGILNDPARIKKLTIDAGPRTVSGANAGQVHFDRATPASYCDADHVGVITLPNYPKSFPADSFADMDLPSGPIDTLGSIFTDAHGRLLVLGGFGRAAGWKIDGTAPVDQDVNNDQWFDDTSDGPVLATLVLDDGTRVDAASAWVSTTDPSFAPQILNVVSCWDDVYDSWLEKMALDPEIYTDNAYQEAYKPAFDEQIAPIFRSASLQQWNTNLSQTGMSAHAMLATISADDDPVSTELAGIVAIFRDPNDVAQQNNTSLMPLHLGDNVSFLTLRKSQYFFLQQWSRGRDGFEAGSGKPLGPGEYLDKATLVNLLGGRFSPGIDLTFIVREPEIYVSPWQTSGAGPFRIRAKKLAYDQFTAHAEEQPEAPVRPLLTCGYVPLHPADRGDPVYQDLGMHDGAPDRPLRQELEPGDVSKFMALPWHTDYNSCATHPPDPNPPGNRKVFWSWPAQRPVAVYAAADLTVWPDVNTGKQAAALGKQRWSVRGAGTDSPLPENWGRYQFRRDMLDNWQRIGTVLQAPAIDMEPLSYSHTFSGAAGKETVSEPIAVPANWYLEVQSLLRDTDLTPVVPFPNFARQPADDPSEAAASLITRDLFHRLLNVQDHPDVLDDARTFVEYWLAKAEHISHSSEHPFDQSYFDYTEQALENRLQMIYQELVDQAAQSDPGDDPLIRTHEDVVERIVQLAPFNLIDGAWLRNVGRTGPMDEVRSLLYSVYMDELGDGDPSKNHCNIYRDLCHDAGYYPPPIESAEFAFDRRFLDSAFDVPAFELAISQFTEDYYPEIIGMTLYLEWEVVELKGTRDLMRYFGFNPHFYVMHIGIDNAVNGHGQRAADAVKLYLSNQRAAGGDEAVAAAWRRIWNGFVAFGNVGAEGSDFQNLLQFKPALREEMIALIERKAKFGSRNHQQHTVGPSRIDEWFANPPAFLDALETHGYITPGDWNNSRMKALMDFETGPMFRVFTDDEIDLWRRYTESLASTGPAKPTLAPASAMSSLIQQLAGEPITKGFMTVKLKDGEGQAHTLDWWLQQSPAEVMRALASPANGVISPGKPDESSFFTETAAPRGALGTVFEQRAALPNVGKCRDVLRYWITEMCPMPIATAEAMAHLIDQLRPIQYGVAGHQRNMLADPRDRTVHTLDWWFRQPAADFMRALASPINEVIIPGKPAESRFFTELIAPTGPMGTVFDLPAAPPNSGTCRDVVSTWIADNCPMPAPPARSLTALTGRPITSRRLSTPRRVSQRRPPSPLRGMGTIH